MKEMIDTQREQKARKWELAEDCMRLEALLASMGGEGNGLGEKARSLEDRLPPQMMTTIRRIAARRNKLLHEVNANIGDPAVFDAEVKQAIQNLEALVSGESKLDYSTARPDKRAELAALEIELHDAAQGTFMRLLGILTIGILSIMSYALATSGQISSVSPYTYFYGVGCSIMVSAIFERLRSSRRKRAYLVRRAQILAGGD